MSPDRISPSSSMLELVRALTAERGKRLGESSAGRIGKQSAPAEHREHDFKVLRLRLSDLVGPVDPDDAETVAQIRRPFLKEIVLWEFGAEFYLDPEFGPTLDTIEHTFDADPSMPGRLADLIRHLRR